ncbi:DnaJ domain-containing protein [Clostridium perfringens]|uniref:DnaJ domain-containing protein n=1 Tax=Clostridium perfringens TaxID=1502 RepID=UPI00096A61F0|nr:DnaJ domain-containing protein [Clostridium perfringens]
MNISMLREMSEIERIKYFAKVTVKQLRELLKGRVKAIYKMNKDSLIDKCLEIVFMKDKEYEEFVSITFLSSQLTNKDELEKMKARAIELYRTLSKRYHPDRNNGCDKKFKEINNLYESIKLGFEQSLNDMKRYARFYEFKERTQNLKAPF